MRLGLPGSRALAAWRDALAQYWLARRVPPESARIRLHRRRLFILPTGLGYAFALTLALLLLGSLNYGTSLGFAVTFLLAGAGALAMVHTYRNLEGIELVFAHPRPVFAGEPLRVPVRLRAGPPRRWSVELEGGDVNPPACDPGHEAPAEREYRFDTGRRGRFPLPRLRVATAWPFGLFRVWSWIWPRVSALVYPARVDHGVPMPRQPAGEGRDQPRSGSDEDFAGLRAYRPGDSPRRIAWRIFACSDELVVKAFESSPAGDLWFEWSQLPSLGPEERLEQLCDWVVRADRQGVRYGLALPDARIDPGAGPPHLARCLEALALVGDAGEAAA